MIQLFESARFKLTAWYLLIIMTISVLFSVIIYEGVNSEFIQFERLQQIREERMELGLPPPRISSYVPPSLLNPAVIAEARHRLISRLIFINTGILLLAGTAGYFLAGRTLKPIAEMVEEQNRFITDASHELRTPLTALRSEIEVGLLNKKLSIKSAQELIKSNLEEVIALQRLSESLLELTQHQNNNESSIYEEVNLEVVVKEAISKVNSLAKKKKITIKNSVTSMVMNGGKDRLRELFVVLLDNAIKYSQTNTTVRISGKTSRRSHAVFIEDTGVGIHVKDIPHIFDRFYRTDTSRSKSDAGGYGLGLSIAKKIVEMHKGSILVKSKINQGSIFTVVLPM